MESTGRTGSARTDPYHLSFSLSRNLSEEARRVWLARVDPGVLMAIEIGPLPATRNRPEAASSVTEYDC